MRIYRILRIIAELGVFLTSGKGRFELYAIGVDFRHGFAEDMTMSNKVRMVRIAVISALMLVPNTVLAQEACVYVDTALTVVRAQEYAPLIAAAAEDGTGDEVEFMSFAASGSWSAVYASTPNSEPGYFFFEDADGRKQFRDVWGGMAEASDEPELVTWANALGAPTDLAECFAEAAVSE